MLPLYGGGSRGHDRRVSHRGGGSSSDTNCPTSFILPRDILQQAGKMSLGKINEVGQFVSELEPEPEQEKKKKGTFLLKKKREKEKV